MRVCLSSLLCLAAATAVAAEQPFLSSKLGRSSTGPSDNCEVGHFGCHKLGDTCFLGEAGEVLGKCVSGGKNNFGQNICNCVESFETRLKANACDEGHAMCTNEGDMCLTGDGRTKGRCHVSHQNKFGKNVCTCLETDSFTLSAATESETEETQEGAAGGDPWFDYLLICQDGASGCNALQAGDVCTGEDGWSKGACMVSGKNDKGQNVCKCVVEEKPKPAVKDQNKCDGSDGCFFMGSSCYRDGKFGFCVKSGTNALGEAKCFCKASWQPTFKPMPSFKPMPPFKPNQPKPFRPWNPFRPNNKATEDEMAKLGATNTVCDEGHHGCTREGDACLTGDGRTQGVCQVSHQNKFGKNVCACVESS